MKRMSLLLGIAAVALTLSGCASLKSALATHVTNPLNDQHVSAIGDALGTAQAAAVAYAALPLCPKGAAPAPASTCHDKQLLRSIDAAMHAADKAYADLVTYQQANPQGSTVVGGNFSQLLTQAQSAIGALTGIEQAYKIGGA